MDILDGTCGPVKFLSEVFLVLRESRGVLQRCRKVATDELVGSD